jgi:allantoinase
MKQRENFFEIWGGIAGVQWTLPALIDHGVNLPQLANLTSSNGAQRFGMDRRGAVAAGAYADLALIDINASQTVGLESLFQRHPITPYLGMKLRGIVRKTVRRGEIIYSEGTITARTPGVLVKPTRNENATSGKHA